MKRLCRSTVAPSARAAAAVPADRLARLSLQSPVELQGVVVDPAPGARPDHMGDLPGRVPGRAGRQLSLLAEDDVGPPFRRQVASDRDAHHAATDDDRACLSRHGQGAPSKTVMGRATVGIRAHRTLPRRPRRRRLARSSIGAPSIVKDREQPSSRGHDAAEARSPRAENCTAWVKWTESASAWSSQRWRAATPHAHCSRTGLMARRSALKNPRQTHVSAEARFAGRLSRGRAPSEEFTGGSRSFHLYSGTYTAFAIGVETGQYSRAVDENRNDSWCVHVHVLLRVGS